MDEILLNRVISVKNIKIEGKNRNSLYKFKLDLIIVYLKLTKDILLLLCDAILIYIML